MTKLFIAQVRTGAGPKPLVTVRAEAEGEARLFLAAEYPDAVIEAIDEPGNWTSDADTGHSAGDVREHPGVEWQASTNASKQDDSEHLDEHGDVPPIELLLDPVAEIPQEELTLLGELMAWTAYIEVDLFLLFLLANPGDEIKRRKLFYKQTAGLYARIQLVRNSFEGRLTGVIEESLNILLNQAENLAKARNEWAHNPIIRFGPKKALMRWTVGSGDFAGKLSKVDGAAIRPHMPDLQRLHQGFTNVASLIRSPTGESYGITFGERSERIEAQLARYLEASKSTD